MPQNETPLYEPINLPSITDRNIKENFRQLYEMVKGLVAASRVPPPTDAEVVEEEEDVELEAEPIYGRWQGNRGPFVSAVVWDQEDYGNPAFRISSFEGNADAGIAVTDAGVYVVCVMHGFPFPTTQGTTFIEINDTMYFEFDYDGLGTYVFIHRFDAGDVLAVVTDNADQPQPAVLSIYRLPGG